MIQSKVILLNVYSRLHDKGAQVKPLEVDEVKSL